MSRIRIAPNVTILNESNRKLYVRGRTIQTPEGPIQAWMVLENPFTGNTVSGHEIGFPGMALLASLAGPALNLVKKHAPKILGGIGKAVKGFMGSPVGQQVRSLAGVIPGAQGLMDAAASGDISKLLTTLPGLPGGSVIANLLKGGKITPAAAVKMAAAKSGAPTSLQMIAPGIVKPRIVRHIPHAGRIPPGYIRVQPVAPSTEGSGFID